MTQLVCWMFTFIRDYGFKVLYERMENISILYVSTKQLIWWGGRPGCTRTSTNSKRHIIQCKSMQKNKSRNVKGKAGSVSECAQREWGTWIIRKKWILNIGTLEPHPCFRRPEGSLRPEEDLKPILRRDLCSQVLMADCFLEIPRTHLTHFLPQWKPQMF